MNKIRKELLKLSFEDVKEIWNHIVQIFNILDKYSFEDFKKTRDVLADLEVDAYHSVLKGRR